MDIMMERRIQSPLTATDIADIESHVSNARERMGSGTTGEEVLLGMIERLVAQVRADRDDACVPTRAQIARAIVAREYCYDAWPSLGLEVRDCFLREADDVRAYIHASLR